MTLLLRLVSAGTQRAEFHKQFWSSETTYLVKQIGWNGEDNDLFCWTCYVSEPNLNDQQMFVANLVHLDKTYL